MKALKLVSLLILLAACSSQQDKLVGEWMNLEGNIVRFEETGAAFVAQEGLEGGQPATWTVEGDALHLVVGDPAKDAIWNEFDLRISPDTLFLVSIHLHANGESETLTSDEMAHRMGRPPERMHFTRHGEDK